MNTPISLECYNFEKVPTASRNRLEVKWDRQSVPLLSSITYNAGSRLYILAAMKSDSDKYSCSVFYGGVLKYRRDFNVSVVDCNDVALKATGPTNSLQSCAQNCTAWRADAMPVSPISEREYACLVTDPQYKRNFPQWMGFTLNPKDDGEENATSSRCVARFNGGFLRTPCNRQSRLECVCQSMAPPPRPTGENATINVTMTVTKASTWATITCNTTVANGVNTSGTLVVLRRGKGAPLPIEVQDGKYRGFYHQHSASAQLNFTDFQCSDNGQYACIVTSLDAKLLARTVSKSLTFASSNTPCSRLPPPDNGSIRAIGENCQVIASCNPGYNLQGSRRRMCKRNGQWDGTATFCEEILCSGKNVPAPWNGTVQFTSGFHPNSIAMFRCDQGFKILGVANVSCRADGTWSSLAPVCVSVLTGQAVEYSYQTLRSLQNKLGGSKLLEKYMLFFSMASPFLLLADKSKTPVANRLSSMVRANVGPKSHRQRRLDDPNYIPPPPEAAAANSGPPPFRPEMYTLNNFNTLDK